MQSSASARRAFSLLASKIHPQLPLSPRESQQLLQLLTTSFRAHLDREHPVASSRPKTSQKLLSAPPRRLQDISTNHPVSSHGSTTEHIDSILFNPLFTAKPHRNKNEDARGLFQNPMHWFMNQVAIGSANLDTAETCVVMLASMKPDDLSSHTSQHAGQPGTRIAQWLWASGLDKSPDFFKRHNLTRLLASLLIKEDQTHRIYQWLENIPQRKVFPTNEHFSEPALRGVSALVNELMSATIAQRSSLDKTFAVFFQINEALSPIPRRPYKRLVHNAGSMLTDYIIANPSLPTSTTLYTSFMDSVRSWGGIWTPAITSSLWLYHPSKANAQPGLEFLKDSETLNRRVRTTTSPDKINFLIQLCLGVSRQLLADKSYTDAHFVLQLTRKLFFEIDPHESKHTGAESTQAKRTKLPIVVSERERIESKNLEMLDDLLPV